MPPKILFVDDEPSFESLIRRHFRKKIRAQELELVFASNGVQALEKIQLEGNIDMVITDINMPQMNGLTLLDKLQVLDPNIKTVVLSAYSDMKNIRTAMNRGAFDFLNKPIDFEDLEITINRTLQQVQQIRENQHNLQATQTQLIQSEKMSALGQLVAGVAHEINNPVGFIAGNLDTAEEYMQDLLDLLNLYQQKFPEPGEEIASKIKEIDLDYLIDDMPELISSMKEGTDRICGLSTSLRTFSRSDMSSKVAFNIHDGIDSTLLVLKHRLKANENRPAIEVIKEYGDLPEIECYPGQLNQVFMNILANAIDALNEASLDLSYNEIKEAPHSIIIQTKFPPGSERVVISIQDNGPGMSEELMGRVFDHLFTTKPVGEGTGLGLSISRQIVVEKHGGELKCVSALGQGAEFIIEIPIQ